MPEVKRCVHLLRKGYEAQKIAVIQNLVRAMHNPGANEELFSLIIVSTTFLTALQDSLLNDDWDDRMQRECAAPFIECLRQETVSVRNKEKVLRTAVKICTDEDNAENTVLLEKWDAVLTAVVSRVDLQCVSDYAVKEIKDMPGLKNTFAKRKRGTKLILLVAGNVGEQGLDFDPTLMKIIRQICGDNNYKFRRDGVLFLKDYFTANKMKILKSERFRYDYLPLLRELINDEDPFIQLDAVEAFTTFSEELSKHEMESDFMPSVMNALDVEHGDTNLELLQRATELVGVIAHKLSEHGMHWAYK
jgi:hypothetical protein